MRIANARIPTRAAGALLIAALTLGFAVGPATASAQSSVERAASAREREAGALPAARAGREIAPDNGGSGLSWIVIAAAAAVVGVLAYVLLKKKSPAAAPTPTPPPPPPPPADVGSLDIRSTPTGAKIFLDGADTGKVTNAVLTGLAVGARAVRLVLDRYQDYAASPTVLKDQTVLVDAALKPGAFTENFNSGAAPFWQGAKGTWAVKSGAYACSAAPPIGWAASQYAFADFADFTLEVKCLITRPNAGSGRGHGILFRATPTLDKYYIFHVNPGSQVAGGPMWDVFEITNDQITRQYDPWQHNAAIVDGLNTIRIEAKGSTFKFYANGTLLGQRTIPEAPASGRIGLSCEVDVNGSEVQFDDVVFTVPAAPSAPAAAGRKR